jgi:hypothetical protein
MMGAHRRLLENASHTHRETPKKSSKSDLSAAGFARRFSASETAGDLVMSGIMHAVEVQTLARQLFDALGPKALAEAAQKAVKYETSGDKSKASDWRRIEAALNHMRGPHAS